ncbi:MAG TPA: hypothetical protein VGP47_06895, partial [Parachlamydiaceae bacterium]|nr:hypothetical protein [Parachlamydiaceae bacterium]
FAANISDAILARAFTSIFTSNVNIDDLIEGANRIVSSIKKNGNEKLLQQYLKPQIKDILRHLSLRHNDERLKFSSWLKDVGVEYTVDTVDTLAYLTDSLCRYPYWKENLKFIRKLFKMNIPLDAQMASGDHLIHCIINNYDLLKSFKAELIRLILNKYPKEFDVPDKIGRGVLSILFLRDLGEIHEVLKDYVNEEMLNHQKEEFHSLIKSNLILKSQAHVEYIYKENFVDYFIHFKKLFYLNISFEKWLIGSEEENLLYVIAFWHPTIIHKMLKVNLISRDTCEIKNIHGESVLDVCERQGKLFEAFEKPDSPIIVDRDVYNCYNEKVKKTGEKPYIFGLFENSIRRASFKSPLLKQLILLNPNITDPSGNTLLHAFFSSQYITSDKLALLLYLLDYGVDPKILNDAGESARDIAKKRNCTFAYPYLR